MDGAVVTFDLEEYRRGLRERRRASGTRYYVIRRSPRKCWLLYFHCPVTLRFQCFRFSRFVECVAWLVRFG